MREGGRVAVLAREPEINQKKLVRVIVKADAKVVGLEIAVDEMPMMDILEGCENLVRKH
jgi:hypothetical protein